MFLGGHAGGSEAGDFLTFIFLGFPAESGSAVARNMFHLGRADACASAPNQPVGGPCGWSPQDPVMPVVSSLVSGPTICTMP